ncbi:hypothetical protein CR155_10890 [Pollutimonas nitritireducens]|uniref:Lipoprotein n=1 Tax=Pollutimonas nitritireducens TaxID=2045209 RepID=A0A2N4UFZ8_9BURK|nr:hypothetical protein [Pollutimonas nitritireducens]PLC53930.1 hypothetical protein CR155_10890 [Pollutimonas nitritireducens]
MNRRHFITAASISALVILAGCKTEPSGEKFIGYWFSDNGRYPPNLVHIERNGESFLFTETAWNNLGKVGYQSNTVPATIKGSENILVVADAAQVAYKEAGDEIVSDSLKARRITEAEYQAAVSKK